jgi:hypothetical protein
MAKLDSEHCQQGSNGPVSIHVHVHACIHPSIYLLINQILEFVPGAAGGFSNQILEFVSGAAGGFSPCMYVCVCSIYSHLIFEIVSHAEGVVVQVGGSFADSSQNHDKRKVKILQTLGVRAVLHVQD